MHTQYTLEHPPGYATELYYHCSTMEFNGVNMSDMASCGSLEDYYLAGRVHMCVHVHLFWAYQGAQAPPSALGLVDVAYRTILFSTPLPGLSYSKPPATIH